MTSFFFFNDTATTEIYTLSLHDALPIYQQMRHAREVGDHRLAADVLAERQGEGRVHLVVSPRADDLPERDHLALLVGDLQSHHALARNDLHHAHRRSEEHTSELQSPCNLVCRL